jgi:hypothetical protein
MKIDQEIRRAVEGVADGWLDAVRLEQLVVAINARVDDWLSSECPSREDATDAALDWLDRCLTHAATALPDDVDARAIDQDAFLDAVLGRFDDDDALLAEGKRLLRVALKN